MNKDQLQALVYKICSRPSVDIIYDAEIEMADSNIFKAVENKDSKPIFNWIMYPASYQGISDNNAESFIDDHGNITYLQISRALNKTKIKCDKLMGFEAFKTCGYTKTSQTCNNPMAFLHCPLPSHPLRNGRLNAMAYSLYFFIRDVCQKDLIGFIDRITSQDKPASEIRDDLVREFSRVYGMQGKIINMVFSTLFLGLGSIRPAWREVGYVTVAIDTLVHNFLHRTGILYYYGMSHGLGACYGPKGCLKVIEKLASFVDCSSYCSRYPKYFPRFVQLSIWLFCSETGESICNGRMIDDKGVCQNTGCPLYSLCDKVSLYGG